jgi:cysteine/O-acetylserine efflux protein
MLVTFMIFSISSIFSPGPANAAASASGQRIGYRRSLRLLAGMAISFSLAMALAGLMAETLRSVMPVASPYLRWAGAAYMVWLAFTIVFPGKAKEGGGADRHGFWAGVLLILANPKLYLFALSAFASFGEYVAATPGRALSTALMLGGMQFAAASLWTLMGLGFSLVFRKKAFSVGFSAAMAFVLLYSAYAAVFH